MKKMQKSAPRIKILPLEEFAGEFDAPSYKALAEAEAAELSEVPGGRFAWGSFRREPRRTARYEREALALRARALAKLT